MDVEAFRKYCLQKKHVEESFPFGDNTLIFKLNNKIFSLLSLNVLRNSCNLKCDPEKAIELREKYIVIQLGYHTNKKHWNPIHFNEDVPDKVLFDLIDHSYTLIFNTFSNKTQKELNE